LRILIPFLFFICLLPECAFSQNISGKIITALEADSLFGTPDKIIKIETTVLRNFTRSSDYLYFNFSGTDLLIFNNKKEPLYPAEHILQGNEVFTIYSSSVVTELLSRGESEYAEIQLRKDVLTISSGSHTLEYGMLCPPYCY
jgi:hypothetical protein